MASLFILFAPKISSLEDLTPEETVGGAWMGIKQSILIYKTSNYPCRKEKARADGVKNLRKQSKQ